MASAWFRNVTGTNASFAGKTSVARMLAGLAGRQLVEVVMTAGSDTSDLLGGFEQQELARHILVLPPLPCHLFLHRLLNPVSFAECGTFLTSLLHLAGAACPCFCQRARSALKLLTQGVRQTALQHRQAYCICLDVLYSCVRFLVRGQPCLVLRYHASALECPTFSRRLLWGLVLTRMTSAASTFDDQVPLTQLFDPFFMVTGAGSASGGPCSYGSRTISQGTGTRS